jgi:hypothetical protein
VGGSETNANVIELHDGADVVLVETGMAIVVDKNEEWQGSLRQPKGIGRFFL